VLLPALAAVLLAAAVAAAYLIVRLHLRHLTQTVAGEGVEIQRVPFSSKSQLSLAVYVFPRLPVAAMSLEC